MTNSRKNLPERTWWFKNLLAEICHFNTQKYKNPFRKANFYHSMHFFFLSIGRELTM